MARVVKKKSRRKLAVKPSKHHSGVTMEQDEENTVVTFTARVPRGLLEALDREAQVFSERAGGVPVSRNAALRIVLQRALHDQRKTTARAAKEKLKTSATPLLTRYRALHSQGYIQHVEAAQACSCSEGTIRRWARGDGGIGAERERIIEAFVEKRGHEVVFDGRAQQLPLPSEPQEGA
jgi:hypothetical protein